MTLRKSSHRLQMMALEAKRPIYYPDLAGVTSGQGIINIQKVNAVAKVVKNERFIGLVSVTSLVRRKEVVTDLPFGWEMRSGRVPSDD